MPKTIDKYIVERQELLQKIFNILEITENNKMFSLKKLDENEDKQKSILDLENDIKKYFLCSKWNYFNNKNREFKRSYLSLIKAIMKDMKIQMIASTIVKKTDVNKTKSETIYLFEL
jgi:hypothetical protein